jgi:hypothetical protein
LKIRTRFILVAVVLSALVFGVLSAGLFLARETTDELARIGGDETALLNQITHAYRQPGDEGGHGRAPCAHP